MKFNSKRHLAKLRKAATKVPKIRTPQDKQKYLEKQAKRMDSQPTGPEYAFIDLLNSIKVKYETQKIVHGKIFDFYVPEKNTLIEIQGNYWHAYGLKVEEMNHIQLRTYKNDQLKEVFAKGLGYGLIIIWEHELDDECFESTKEKVRNLLR